MYEKPGLRETQNRPFCKLKGVEHTLVSDKTGAEVRVIIYLHFTEILAQSYIFLM